MYTRFHRQCLLLAVAGLQLAACSERAGVAPPPPAAAPAPVHASAAQRVDLPGASAAAVSGAAVPGASAATGVGVRVQPATPEVLRFPDGTVGVKVAQQYAHTIVACRLPDGTFTTDCPPGAERRP
ncbi:MAG: hypothetical protein KGL25_04955 [Gammaproteobacteria bacterium]|nr:hypothetical protein [Gammaproteobacteria bacterium]